MRAYLQTGVRVQTLHGRPVLVREGVPVAHPLQIGEALALTFLAATGDPQSAAAYCSDCLPGAAGETWVGRVLERYWTYLGPGQPRPVELHWMEGLRLNDPGPPPGLRRQAAPSALIWLVTLACNRRCPYCFYRITPHPVDRQESPQDATITRRRVCEILEEMGQIGTADLYLSGGEPLLRRDLAELIGHASSCRVRTHLVTKYPITPGLARRLALAGLTRITLSLDDARPGSAAALAGSPDYLAESTRAIQAVLKADLDLEINAVVTRLNEGHLEDLVRYVVALGAPRLSISPYSVPYPVRAPALRLVPDNDELDTRLARLRERFGQRIELRIGGPDPQPHQRDTGCAPVCDVGFRDLHMLPDGGVTRCRYLPGERGLILGSLARRGILEIWNSARFRDSVEPPPEAFRGSACQGCRGSEGCNQRGRCVVSALIREGRLHGPDAHCQRHIAP